MVRKSGSIVDRPLLPHVVSCQSKGSSTGISNSSLWCSGLAESCVVLQVVEDRSRLLPHSHWTPVPLAVRSFLLVAPAGVFHRHCKWNVWPLPAHRLWPWSNFKILKKRSRSGCPSPSCARRTNRERLNLSASGKARPSSGGSSLCSGSSSSGSSIAPARISCSSPWCSSCPGSSRWQSSGPPTCPGSSIFLKCSLMT